MSVEIKVYVEETGEELSISLSPEDAETAGRDRGFLENLVRSDKKRKEAEINVDCEESQCSTGSNYETAKENGEEKSLFIWTTPCVQLLLAQYEENAEKFSGGTQRHQKIWQIIATKLNDHGYAVTWAQCQSKLNGLKRTYKKILDHNQVSGNDRKSWPYFQQMDELFGSTGWALPVSTAMEAGPEPVATSRHAQSSTPPRKKKVVIPDVVNIWNEIKEDRKVAREEKKKEQERKQIEKNKQHDELLSQRERQHNEKMELMRLLLQAPRPR